MVLTKSNENDYEEKIKKNIKKGLNYIFTQQKDDEKDDDYGGFSPYPISRKSAGVIATSDVITSFLLLLKEIEFDQNFKKEILEMKVKNKTLIERIGMATNFILNSQILDNKEEQRGGFPPRGDIYDISTIAFSDSTATAVLALLHVLNNMEEYKIVLRKQEGGEITKEELKERISLGISWLIRNFNSDNLLPTYISKKESSIEKRLFPLIFTGLSFFVAVTEKEKIKDKETITTKLEEIVKILGNLIKENGHVPFNLNEKESPSFFNTFIALQLLWLNEQIRYEDVVNNLKKRLKENIVKLGGQTLRRKIKIYTDFDYIDTSKISEAFPFYEATYFFLPPLLSLLMVYNTPLEEVKNGIEELINLAGKNDHFYCYEDRGGLEIAISATASTILTMGTFLRKIKG